jgi:hypothetical protein
MPLLLRWDFPYRIVPVFRVGLVRVRGLEPPRLAALEPKSSASTNSATPASAGRSSEIGRSYITGSGTIKGKKAKSLVRF